MGGVRQYLLMLCAASAVCSVINALLESKGSVTKIIRLLTGMFIALCAISPLLNVERWDISSFTDSINLSTSAIEEGKNMADEIKSEIISEQVTAYVLNKAAAMGLSINAEVILDDDSPKHPKGIILIGSASPYAKEILGQYISDNLGISKEDQYWE